jgi:hypothetical protein
MAKLDQLIIDNVKERFLGGDRLARILDALVEREAAKDEAVQERVRSLSAEVLDRDDRLKRLYRAIEEGAVELDDDLKQRIQALKEERQTAQATLDRMAVQARTKMDFTPDRLEAFSNLVREKLDSTEAPCRKAYLQSVIVGSRSGRRI